MFTRRRDVCTAASRNAIDDDHNYYELRSYDCGPLKQNTQSSVGRSSRCRPLRSMQARSGKAIGGQVLTYNRFYVCQQQNGRKFNVMQHGHRSPTSVLILNACAARIGTRQSTNLLSRVVFFLNILRTTINDITIHQLLLL